jgi:hypothetical protein
MEKNKRVPEQRTKIKNEEVKNMKAALCITGFCALVCLVSTSPAVLTQVKSFDLPEQDPLFVPRVVHELGLMWMEFPPEEGIEAWDEYTEQTACPGFPGDNPTIPNALVYMFNMTGQAWTDVWYVADGRDPFAPNQTSLTNYDGLVNDVLAFKIDYFGMNRSLVYEDNPNGIFEPGEIWGFIIQDYQNMWGLPASALGSIGVPSMFTGDQLSSGSIIAIPEPMTLTLLGLGGLLVRRR